MSEMFGDIQFAQIVEKMAATDDEAYLQSMRSLLPKRTYEVFEFDGGNSCYAGNSPFTNTHGFGTSPEHAKNLLREIEGFFGKYNCPAILSVPSVASSVAIRALFDAGYSPLGYRNVYLHRPLSENPQISNNDIQIVEVSSSADIEKWMKVVSNGFAGEELAEPDEISLGQSQKVGNRFFLGYLGDEVAAGATLYVNGNFARLGGMATLPKFRGQGLQTEMINKRIQCAIDSGCSVIVSDTTPGNNSQRNLERCGFKLAYVRGIYRKTC